MPSDDITARRNVAQGLCAGYSQRFLIRIQTALSLKSDWFGGGGISGSALRTHLLLAKVVPRPAMQPTQSYSVRGKRSSGQLTGKPAGARPDHRGRWCAVSQGHPGPGDALPIVRRPLGAPVHGRLWNSLDSNQQHPGYRAHPALHAERLYRMRYSGAQR
ncbi:UNVERIFIED_CONTAM: hypothetical protein FKN15_062803 [Acipenser sinensis]